MLLAALAFACSEAAVTMDTVEEKLRVLNPVFMMGEELFRLENKNNCLEKMFCLLETTLQEIGRLNPLKHFSRVLTNTEKDFDEIAAEKVNALAHRYPHFASLVDAILLGQSTINNTTCHATYDACRTEEETLVKFALSLEEDIRHQRSAIVHEKKSNAYCDGANVGCALVGAGCALCTVATEGICGAACLPEVGAYCSGTSLGCYLGEKLFG